jgi:hypothetical protein
VKELIDFVNRLGGGPILGIVAMVLLVFWAFFPIIVWGKLSQIEKHARKIREHIEEGQADRKIEENEVS